jgi:hypothetical protein
MNMRCLLHTTLTSTLTLNATVTLIYTPIPTFNPTLTDTLITSSTVNPILTRTLTLNFIPTTYFSLNRISKISPALVLFQSCLDPSHNLKLLPNPTFSSNYFGETGFGEPGGHQFYPLVIGKLSIGYLNYVSPRSQLGSRLQISRIF